MSNICRTVACATVAIPALTRAQYASAVARATDRPSLRYGRAALAMLAIVASGLMWGTVARLDASHRASEAARASHVSIVSAR